MTDNVKSRILVLAATTGYQTRSFGEAAEAQGIELVFATDRCHQLDDPWRDAAIPIRFHDEAASVEAIVDAVRVSPIDGVLALGDRPTVIAALAAERLGLPGNPPASAEISRNKLATRAAFRRAGLSTPWFFDVALDVDPATLANDVMFPCVVKPLALSGSRGVIRADDAPSFIEAFERLRRLLMEVDVRVLRDPANDRVLVEGFIEGRELAIEGVIDHGCRRTLAIFEKPDPLDGPFFEETIYLTPPRLEDSTQVATATVLDRAIDAIGLRHGPFHAECRVHEGRVTVLEVAARPIGGLCSRALRFVSPAGQTLSLEGLLLRLAAGDDIDGYQREPHASGVMMVPIPARGVYRRVDGVESALAVDGVTEIQMTAKPDQRLVPLPEGASYLGFIFARGATTGDVELAIRTAHSRLSFVIEPEIAVVPAR